MINEAEINRRSKIMMGMGFSSDGWIWVLDELIYSHTTMIYATKDAFDMTHAAFLDRAKEIIAERKGK